MNVVAPAFWSDGDVAHDGSSTVWYGAYSLRSSLKNVHRYTIEQEASDAAGTWEMVCDGSSTPGLLSCETPGLSVDLTYKFRVHARTCVGTF